MSSTKAVSMDSSLVGLLSFAAPDVFPLAPLIHRRAQRGDRGTRVKVLMVMGLGGMALFR
jgi:hypothetical protein